MKTDPRKTKSILIAKRISAPETRPVEGSDKRVPLLSFIDAGSYQQHKDTTKSIFLYAAGTNEEGEIPDGLDRLLHHRYRVHLDDNDKAIGLDVIPNRQYRSGVVPTSQVDVNTIIIQYIADGIIARVIQRPFNVRFEQSARVIDELDALLKKGKAITTSMRIGNTGRVVKVTEDTVEIRLNTAGRQVQGSTADVADSLAD